MTASRAYVLELESALKELKIIVRNKFSGREAIFDFVWRGLEKEPATLDGLDSQYKLEIANLKTKIEKFRTEKKIPQEVSGDQDVSVLTKLLSLRHQLSRQHFIARQLSLLDWEKIQYTLGRLRRENQFALTAYKKIDLAKIRLYFSDFNEITLKILLTLKEKNLIEDTIEGNAKQLSVNSNTKEIIKIKEHLIFLPSWGELNNNPHSADDEFAEAVGQMTVNVASLSVKYEELLNEIGALKELLSNKINDTNVETQVTDYFDWLVKIGVKGSIVLDTEKPTRELMEALNDGALFGNKISVFAGASDKLQRRFLAIDSDSLFCELKKFIAFYEKFIPETEELTDQKNVLNENSLQLNKSFLDFSKQLSNAKTTWNQAKDALEKISDKIEKLTGNKKSTTFMARHWWKLLVGAVIGCAIAGVTIFFAFPVISVTVFSVLSVVATVSASAMLGIAIAATVCKAIDSCFKPAPPAERRDFLTEDDRWRRFNEAFDTSSEEEKTPDIRKRSVKPEEVPSLPEKAEPAPSFERPFPSAPIAIPLPNNQRPWYNPVTWFWKPAPVSSINPELAADIVKKTI